MYEWIHEECYSQMSLLNGFICLFSIILRHLTLSSYKSNPVEQSVPVKNSLEQVYYLCNQGVSRHFSCVWKWKWSHSVVTLCDPMDCSLSGSSVHGIFQARVLEWIAVSFSRNRIRVSHIAGRHYTVWAARWAQGKIVSWKSASFTLVPLYKPYQLMFSYQSKCLQFELLSFSTFICL